MGCASCFKLCATADAAAAGAHAQPAAGAGLGSPGQPAFAAADVADGGAGDAEGEQGGGFDNVDDEYAHLGGGWWR